MFRNLPFFVVVILSVSSCNHVRVNADKQKSVSHVNPHVKAKQKSSGVKKPVPVWGYRFVITGDFNGDGKKDTLTEHYFSGIIHKETNKFYDNADYDYDWEMTHRQKPYSFISCNDPAIHKLEIAKEATFGLLYLKNEGDLNGDGRDEISLVRNNADFSSLNEYSIMTYKNNGWVNLYWFPIWEWQLPQLPEASNQYGLFGIDGVAITNSDTTNQRLLKELTSFGGLAKKVSKNKIRIIYRSKEISVDTIIVKLKDHHPPL
ncbi:hypothetical protein ACFFGT_28315 [Mucilaginibacter angelicae]|uniref:VCBS repeat-containing protein n=1 Tax=Mucilaginibacter angelicae TaxID=869718 RepID=A0ABV6LFB2_9SPHI